MGGCQDMGDFNWCHGPNCHTNTTVDRIRGSKGNKVLRTRKITENQYGWSHWDIEKKVVDNA